MSGKRLNPYQHALKRPDTYIGTIVTTEREVYTLKEDGTIEFRNIIYNEGLINIIREIGSNCIDNSWRSQEVNIPMTSIKVMFDTDTKELSFYNDGAFISAEKENFEYEDHRTGKVTSENMYPAEIYFGDMLAGSNYSDDVVRKTSGRNGMGSKCVSQDTVIPLWNGTHVKAKDIQIGDELIGDDGNPRKVLEVFHGEGIMYKIDQNLGASYTVNDQHTLTLHMPDHKVIFWNSTKNGWSVLWWDKEECKIKSKCEIAFTPCIECGECGIELSGNLNRHYRRCHPGVPIPKLIRKKPIIIPNLQDSRIILSKHKLEEFCESIDNDNVFDIDLQDFMNLDKTTQRRLAGVRGKCVEWPKVEVELDPYILGLWLGDGGAYGYAYTCDGDNDTQIMEYFHKWASENDAKINRYGKSQFKKRGYSPLINRLKKYDLVQNKHIPLDYIKNDRETRLALLAGFIDSDGTVMRDGTRILISQGLYHAKLFEDLVKLTRSLGFCCSVSTKKTTWTYLGEKKTGMALYLNISGSGLEDIPTVLPRKVCASTKKKNTSKSTGYITVAKVEDGKYVGIKIDGNERFIINDHTVTHNCTNIFSKSFTVEHTDPNAGKKFIQEFTNNAKNRTKPKLTAFSGKSGWTKITFIPDYERFGYDLNKPEILADFIDLLRMYAAEIAAVSSIPTTFTVDKESKKYVINTFEKFARMFYPDVKTNKIGSLKLPNGDECVVVESHIDGADMDDEIDDCRHLAYVNGIRTKLGGIHVNVWRDTIMSAFVRAFNARTVPKGKTVSKTTAKKTYPYLTFFIRTEFDKPVFDSQTKQKLEGRQAPSNKDGTTTGATVISDYTVIPKGKSKKDVEQAAEMKEAIEVLVKKMLKWSFIPLLEAKLSGKSEKLVTGKAKGNKVHDCRNSGKYPERCTLWITEGLSPKALIVTGISAIDDRGMDDNGILAIQGKFLNVRTATQKQIDGNVEIQLLRQMLGLTSTKIDYVDPENFKKVRYHKVRIAADMDDDGIHIRGLLINFFHKLYPSLLKNNDFLESFSTGAVKVTFKGNKEVKVFYSPLEYMKWYNDYTMGPSIDEAKYLKGLASINTKDVHMYFDTLKIVKFYLEGDEEDYMNMGFGGKEFAKWKKEWVLREMKKAKYPTAKVTESENEMSDDSSQSGDENSVDDAFVYDGEYSISRFVDGQLSIYHRMALHRALPSDYDGLKEAQRKILFGVMQLPGTKTKDLEKVIGLIKTVSEYHHGGKSISGAIAGMATRYPGDNNIPLLVNDGQFSTRLLGPSVFGQDRYLHTALEPIMKDIFKVEDLALLTTRIIDNNSAEPEFYLPVINMLAVNGSEGIASAFSTKIPCHNPIDILNYQLCWLDNKHKDLPPIKPWYRGIKGPIELVEENGKRRWTSEGILTECIGKGCTIKIGQKKSKCHGIKGWWHITDLPVGYWSDDFKDDLEKLTEESKNKQGVKSPRKIIEFANYCTNDLVHFMIKPAKDWEPTLENLKMKSTYSLNNMIAIDTNHYPTKYKSVEELVNSWMPRRLYFYNLRRDHLLSTLQHEKEIASSKYIYVKAVVDGKIKMYQSKVALEKDLAKLGLKKMITNEKPKQSDDEDEDNDKKKKLEPSYKYLFSLQMVSMSVEKLEKLKKHADMCQQKIDILNKKKGADLWKEDMEKLRISWGKFIKENPHL